MVVHGFEWGNDEAFTIIDEVLGRFQSTAAICVGIAGNISKDAELGDVFYSKSIINLTQRLKLSRTKTGRQTTQYDPITHRCCEKISRALDKARLSVDDLSTYKKWRDACALRNRGISCQIDFSPLGKTFEAFSRPRANNAQIASTNAVLADQNAVEDVHACGRKIGCVDTESAGFARACEKHCVGSITVVRGVSDYADKTKAITEVSFKGAFRNLAIDNAVEFLSAHIHDILEASAQQLQQSLETKSAPSLADRIRENEVTIREELKRRSVVFKTSGDTEKMPVPRLKEELRHDVTPDEEAPAALEIEALIHDHKRTLVEMPKNYPDRSLPWLYADILTEANAHGAYTVPICIRESNFGPPKNDLDAHLESKGLIEIKNNDDFHIIFIFVDLNVDSRSKSKFLNSCLNDYTNCSLIIFTDRIISDIYHNEVIDNISPDVFLIEGNSFASIAYWYCVCAVSVRFS
ncbi:MAG: hypothetical protein AAFX02_03360 [Pseudomonadota bacterium]